ncbi:MAG: 3'-5' exonuclease, partial [Bacteroidota bacterium]|nr:3'-5' exonuclease [Bacteroidota bacterium]
HSSKGREFDAVILFGMNYDIIPNGFERRNEAQFKESRRLFYVGVTRARKHLHLVFRNKYHSPFVQELYNRITS